MLEERQRLDQFALDIEFLLISVVQGVALAALAAVAAHPIGQLQFQHWVYIATAFILILTFWSQAIVHAVSFIDWPLNLAHNFLYFGASFVEVMLFSQITNPIAWYGFACAFFVVVFFLYYFDLRLITDHFARKQSPQAQTLYAHILARHRFEYTKLLPVAFGYNLIAFLCILWLPEFFIGQGNHIYLGFGQLLGSLVVLVDATRNFNRRATLISKAYQKKNEHQSH